MVAKLVAAKRTGQLTGCDVSIDTGSHRMRAHWLVGTII